MTERQGLITYEGLAKVVGGTVTWSRGTSPSVISIDTTPQVNLTQPVGDVVIDYGEPILGVGINPADPERVTVTLVDCAVDFSTITVGQGQTWTMQLYDRRWRWQFGQVSGRYNQRKPDGTLDTATEKTPRELLTLCLTALGESGYDLTSVPNTARPEAVWDAENPARAMQPVLEATRCEVVLRLDSTNSVAIYPIGDGATLPGDKVMSFGASLQTGQRPGTLRGLTKPILIQRRLKLVAVGLDTDDEVKPLFSLSYRPAAGFTDPLFMNDVSAGEDELTLARRSVFRWFRVESFADGTLNLPWVTPALPLGFLADVKQIRLTQGLIESQASGDRTEPKEPRLYGKFFDNTYAGANVEQRYPGEFSVDQARQVIQTREPVVLVNDTTGLVEEPELYVEIAFEVEDSVGAPMRYERDRTMPGTTYGAGVHVERVEGSRRTIRVPYTDTTTEGTPVDNHATVDTEVDAILDAVQSRYEADEGDEAVYGGIKAIDLDGAIQQVIWSVGNGQAATTRAARNRDADQLAESEDSRRKKQKEEAAAEKAEKLFFADGSAKPRSALSLP